jgi:hypothetical protein
MPLHKTSLQESLRRKQATAFFRKVRELLNSGKKKETSRTYIKKEFIEKYVHVLLRFIYSNFLKILR